MVPDSVTCRLSFYQFNQLVPGCFNHGTKLLSQIGRMRLQDLHISLYPFDLAPNAMSNLMHVVAIGTTVAYGNLPFHVGQQPAVLNQLTGLPCLTAVKPEALQPLRW